MTRSRISAPALAGEFAEFFQRFFGAMGVGTPGASARFPIEANQDRAFGNDVTECRFYASEESA